ncbi:FlgN protein OS=Afipia felis OX=1035 GN=NCTC12722_01512 PE=4 SV=1 [Afipia felis]
MNATPAQTAAAAPIVPASTPADAQRLANGLMSVMASLLDIVDQETELVRAGKVREAVALEAVKGEASRNYMRAVSEIKHSADYLKRSTPDLLATLHRHHDTFRAMLQVNLTVLATAHAVSEGIIRGVNNEIQRRRNPQGYTAAGQRAAPNHRYAAPLTLSRSL